MKNYERPVVTIEEGFGEGVFAASGDASDCYSVGARIHQTPQQGRGDFRIQTDATHAASDGHHSTEQVLTMSFNQPVVYKWSNGTLVSGDGSTSISIRYNYHNNGNEFIGLGDVVVEADPGLAVTGAVLSCNHSCSQH